MRYYAIIIRLLPLYDEAINNRISVLPLISILGISYLLRQQKWVKCFYFTILLFSIIHSS